MHGIHLLDFELPVGAVLPYAGPINPCTQKQLEARGYLLCDGSPRYAAEYPELFAVIRRLYGYPKGAENNEGVFCLPDYRGLFLRGLDRGAGVDPGAADRTSANPATSSGNTGDQVGSREADAFQEHEHQTTIVFTTPPSPPPSSPSQLGLINGEAAATPLMSGTTSTSAITDQGDDQERNTTETRPVNAAVNFIIKARSRAPTALFLSKWCVDTKDTWPDKT